MYHALQLRRENEVRQQDRRTALICHVLTGGKVELDKFMPRYGPVEQKHEQTPEEMLEQVKLLNAAFGGS